MKVLHITSSFPRSRNDNSGSFLLDFISKLEKNGIENTVLAPESSSQEKMNYPFKTNFFQYLPKHYENLPNNSLTHLSKSLLFELPFYSLSAIANLINSNDYDVLHAHWAIPMGFLTSISQILKVRSKKPLLITCHGQDVVLALNKKFYRYSAMFGLRRANKITCDANHLQDKLKMLGLPSSKISTFYIGVDPNRFNPSCYSNYKAEFDLKDGFPLIGSLGSLLPNKRIDLLLKAFKIVNQKVDSHLVICGNGPLYQTLIKLARKLGIETNTTFLKGIERRQVPLYLSQLDVFSLPSLREGLSIALQESMAMENAPVISDTIDASDLIDNGVNGLYASCSNVNHFATQLIAAIDNSNEIGKNARKTIIDRFDINSTSKRLVKQYEELVQ